MKMITSLAVSAMLVAGMSLASAQTSQQPIGGGGGMKEGAAPQEQQRVVPRRAPERTQPPVGGGGGMREGAAPQERGATIGAGGRPGGESRPATRQGQ